MQWRWIAVVLAATLAEASAQQLVPHSQAQVLLEAKHGRTQFSLGDVIALELVFRDLAFPEVLPAKSPRLPVAGQTIVNATDYEDIADDVAIAPASGWFQWRGNSGHDYLNEAPVDAAGVRVPLVLNQGYVFREPGHYEITVTTRRMGGHPVTTNTVSIDISARSAEDEAALVETLEATIASAARDQRENEVCDGQESAALQLAYLTGDDAAWAKVKLLLGPDEDVAEKMVPGLAATKNQALQLDLLKAAWANPHVAPDRTLQSALQQAEAFARGQMEPGWVAWRPAPEQNATMRAALDAEYRADLERIIATLPQRTGDVRRDTAYDLVEHNQLSPDQLARLKPIVLEEFPRMEPVAQSTLIENNWNALKDPSLAPYLKAMIESKAHDMDAATAVERLVEIDGRDAKPYVIEMICRAKRGLSIDKLNGLEQDRLPEVDDCLAALLAKGEPNVNDLAWEQAAQRAARFATPAILPQVKAAWTNASQDPSMLALLMRDAPGEAVALLNREPEIQWYAANTVYAALSGKFPAEVLAWLRRPSAPRFAAYELAQFGEPQDLARLEQRLETLRRQWIGRAAEMKDAQPGTAAYLAAIEEPELVRALLGARAWTLTDEEKLKITAGCLSESCQIYAPHQNAAALK